MLDDPRSLVASYLTWLDQGISAEQSGELVVITAPFRDRHNDHLQICVKALGDRLHLSDDGHILRDLATSGCDVSTPHRQELLHTLARNFGVQVAGDELTVEATTATFAQCYHSLLQAMLAVDQLALTNRRTARASFREQVKQFLAEQRVRFVPSVQVTGRSGLAHRFDYVVGSLDAAPERIIQTVVRPSRAGVARLLFAWDDIRHTRPGPVALYALVNDAEQSLRAALLQACRASGVEVIPWSERQRLAADLTA